MVTRDFFGGRAKAALERYETVRAPDGYRDPRLPQDLGIVHALIATGGDSEDGVTYYRGEPMTAECLRKVKVRLSVPFDPDDPDACPACAAMSRGERNRPRARVSAPGCHATARDDEDHRVRCVHLAGHSGSHRTSRGQVWEDGPRYVSPAPEDYGVSGRDSADW